MMWITGRSTGRNRYLYLIASLALSLTLLVTAATGEPWVDTRNAPLRADIERLSRAGLIQVPINTWPLMWSGVLNDLEPTAGAKTLTILELQNSRARVLAAGRRATRTDRAHQSLSLSAVNQSQLIRHFGDNTRDEAQLTLRRNGISEHFAYNLEISRVKNP
ncbi:hypothetical protein N9P24_00820 [bacterium]|nr:hypothetical protein [bacterium]